MSTRRKAVCVAALMGFLSAAAMNANAAVQAAEKTWQQCRIVRATEGWRNTGITVNPGQFVCVAADGLWSHGIQGIELITPYYGPEGFAKDDPVNVPEVVARVGALIGRIGQNPPFVVETGLCFIPTVSGQLMLSMNDNPGAFGNNAGYVRAAIAIWPASVRADRIRLPSPASACPGPHAENDRPE